MLAFLKNEEGLETVEYAIITGLIVVATITLIGTIGTWVHDTFNTLASSLP
jgi:Flp pilus assembly pilin Flp